MDWNKLGQPAIETVEGDVELKKKYECAMRDKTSVFEFPFFLKSSELLNEAISKKKDEPETDDFAKYLSAWELNCESEGYKTQIVDTCACEGAGRCFN